MNSACLLLLDAMSECFLFSISSLKFFELQIMMSWFCSDFEIWWSCSSREFLTLYGFGMWLMVCIGLKTIFCYLLEVSIRRFFKIGGEVGDALRDVSDYSSSFFFSVVVEIFGLKCWGFSGRLVLEAARIVSIGFCFVSYGIFKLTLSWLRGLTSNFCVTSIDEVTLCF